LLASALPILVVQACTDRAPASSAAEPDSGSQATTVGAVGAATDGPFSFILSGGPDDAAVVACDRDAATAAQCSVPPPQCSDGLGVFYSGGYCIHGRCEWQVTTIQCSGGEAPEGGRCAPPGVSAASGAILDEAGAWYASSGCLYPIVESPPPQASCDADGGADSGDCPPPRSVCGAGGWLIYFDQGECVAGQCAWQKQYTHCQYGCSNGACGGLPTAQ
jgi:hypothetical protein